MAKFKYTTRAEAFIDIAKFLSQEKLFGRITCFKIEQDYKKRGLDTMFEFYSNLTKMQIIRIMELVPDSRLMIANLNQEVVLKKLNK